MKEKTLIITEDNAEILGISNSFLKGLFVLYIKLYKYLLTKAILGVSNNNILLVTNNLYKPEDTQNVKIKLYNEIWGNLNWEEIRETSWEKAKNWFRPIKNYENEMTIDNLFLNNISETRIALHLARSVISYKYLIENEIHNFKPDKIITISLNSPVENFAKECAKNYKIPFRSLSIINIFAIYPLIRRFFWVLEEKKILDNLKKISVYKSNQTVNDYLLIVVSHELHLKSLNSLLNKCKEKNIKVKIIGDIKYQDSSINENFLKYMTFEKIRTLYLRYKSKNKTLLNNFSSDLKEYLDKYLLQAFKEKLSQYTGFSAVYGVAAEKFLSRENPKAIVFISDRGAIENSFAKKGKELNIPTFLVTPNTLMSLDKTNRYNIADHVLVPGENIKKELLEIGLPKEKISIVGDLRFDEYFSRRFDKQAILNKSALSSNYKYLLLISTYVSSAVSYNEKKSAFRLVNNAVKNLKNYRLLIKAHPNENLEVLKSQVKQWDINGSIVTGNLQEFLCISEAIAQTFSMSGLEAIVFNKPIFVINPKSTYEKHIPYIKNKAAIGVNTSEELFENLLKLEKDHKFKDNLLKKARNFCKNYVGLLDGKASERTVEIIKKLGKF